MDNGQYIVVFSKNFDVDLHLEKAPISVQNWRSLFVTTVPAPISCCATVKKSILPLL